MDGFSKDGRKLRPRKTAAGAVRTEKVDFSSESSPRPYSERRSFSDHKPYGKPYGERKPYGEHKTYGDRPQRPYGERPQRPYGDRPQRPYGEHRAYGESKPYGEGRPYGENKPYGESKPYGERRSFGEGKPYGDRPQRPYGERPAKPRKGGKRGPSPAANEGIKRMINRRPRVDQPYDGPAYEPEVVKNEIRLNRFMANSGVCSRREADTFIEAGCVTVNGEVVTELGTKVNIFDDDVRFNGERLRGESKVYLVMNKPKGYVTSASDPHADKTVMDLIKNCPTRVYPVGRLDKATTGVLMFTNDGEIAERLTHPSYDKKKIYQVSLDRSLSQEDFDKIVQGITLGDGFVQADELEYVDERDHSKLGIEIHSGKNRIVRRIFESLGYTVKALDRVYFAGLTKKGLKKGAWRYLSESEVNMLKMGAYV